MLECALLADPGQARHHRVTQYHVEYQPYQTLTLLSSLLTRPQPGNHWQCTHVYLVTGMQVSYHKLLPFKLTS